MTPAERVKQLEAVEEAVRFALHDIERELNAAMLELYEVQVGDVVEATLRGSDEWVEARVVRIDLASWRRPWLTVNLRKKDGSWGTGARNVFDDWRKPA